MVGETKGPKRSKGTGGTSGKEVPPKRPLRPAPGMAASTAEPSSKVPPAPPKGGNVPAHVPAPFTPEFYEAVNKGPLEEAYEERNRDPRHWTPIPWGLVLVGILIGLVFSYVNIYAALAVGITVGGSFYLTYFLGTMMRWKPGVINYVGGASTGASQVVIGLAFVLPALFFLSDRVAGEGALYVFDELPSPYALAGFFLVGGIYGVLFFLFYRRLWLVERPLQYPGGFESTMELLGIAAQDERADRRIARQSLFVVSITALVAAFFVFLRDLRAFGPAGSPQSWLDDVFGSRYYAGGVSPDIGEFRPFYNGLVFFDPFFLAIGWFIRFRVALILLLGALVTHILAFFDPSATGAFDLLGVWAVNRRTIAAGVILGAGLFALFRLRETIGAGLRTIFSPAASDGRHSRPLVLSVLIGGIILATFLMWIGGVPLGGAFLAVLVGTLLVGILGIIAVKVTGETSVQAVSPMTILALLALMAVLQLVGYSGATLAILALGGAAFFATGLVMSTDMLIDQKIALYVGNPPHRQAFVQFAGLVPGVLLGSAVVWYLSGQIADGEVTGLTAPFGNVFAGLVTTFSGGEIDWTIFLIAMVLGAFVELATGLGTAFGIGMALQLFAPFTIFLGALGREAFERLGGGKGWDKGTLARVAAPTGAFVGASVAAIVVFVLNQFVFN